MKRKGNRKNKAFIFVLLALLSIMATGFVMGRTTSPKYEIRYDYTVKSGDTLWNIGKEVVGESEDIRDWVWKVQEINDIDIRKEPLHPGQTIVIYRH